MQSMIEYSIDDVQKIIDNYILISIEDLKKTFQQSKDEAIRLVTRRRFFGLIPPLLSNPTPEDAIKIAKEKLNYGGYSLQFYRARRIQAKRFQDVIDNCKDRNAKFYMTVKDHSMLTKGDYTMDSFWDSNSWDMNTDPQFKMIKNGQIS